MTFTVPPLQSGGVMLTYKCDNACRHCLYCCSPKSSDEVMSEEMVDRTMSALSKERSLDGIHFGGGECSLFFDRLLYAVRSAVKHGVRIDYLETNGGWCVDDQTALDGFKRLRDAGLQGVLISASLFHLEFIPLNVTKTAIRAAHKVFGGAFVWTGEVLRLMERLPDHNKKYLIRESCRLLGINPADGTLWQIHSYLNPCGRAARRLGGCGDTRLMHSKPIPVGRRSVKPRIFTLIRMAICLHVAPAFRLRTWTICIRRSMSRRHHFSWRCAMAMWSRHGSGMPQSLSQILPDTLANAISVSNCGSICLNRTHSPNCARRRCIGVDVFSYIYFRN